MMTASPPELFSGSGDDMMSTLGVVMSAKLCQRMLYSEWAPGFPRRDIDERWRFAVDNVGHRIRTSLEAHGCVLGARVPWYNTPCVLCLLKSGCGLVEGLAATSVSPAFRSDGEVRLQAWLQLLARLLLARRSLLPRLGYM